MSGRSLISAGVFTRFRPATVASALVLIGTGVAWCRAFWLMAQSHAVLDLIGVLLSAEAMVLAAYLLHEAAHQNLFVSARGNRWAGEAASFLAGGAYASFEHIRHLHIRHHLDRADLVCFDLRGLLSRHPRLRGCLQGLEWAYIPAVELLMHAQLILRPMLERSQRRHLPRAAGMLVLRAGLLGCCARIMRRHISPGWNAQVTKCGRAS